MFHLPFHFVRDVQVLGLSFHDAMRRITRI
jgi:hypothetical protein